MFYGSNYSFREMALIWFVVMSVWGISLVVALKMGSIELTALQKAIVIQLAGLAALFPIIGLILAPVVAIYLIYRIADAELPIIVAAVLVTRFIAAIIAIGIQRVLIHFGLLKG